MPQFGIAVSCSRFRGRVGLRRWIKAPISQGAWVRIPPGPRIFFLRCPTCLPNSPPQPVSLEPPSSSRGSCDAKQETRGFFPASSSQVLHNRCSILLSVTSSDASTNGKADDSSRPQMEQIGSKLDTCCPRRFVVVGLHRILRCCLPVHRTSWRARPWGCPQWRVEDGHHRFNG